MDETDGTPTERPAPRLAVLISFSGAGGVERMVLNLLDEFARRGVAVDLLVIRAAGAHLDSLPRAVNVVRLGAKHALTSVPALIRYLRAARPPALLAAKDRAGRAALWARRLSGVDTRVVVRLGTTLSAALRGRGVLRRWARYLPMRWSYGMAERIIAVSQGVAADTAAISGVPEERIVVIRNPVVNERLLRLARAATPHAWLAGGGPPVVLGAGRLTAQKDFATLLRAFARVRAARDCRLIILGEGRERARLEALADELGVRADLALPGFAVNPYAYMARAALFALSSRWEGSPNVLTEALALGIPVVATDCPSGPREILAGGRYGPLVPSGDDAALAEAILTTLRAPPAAATLREAAAEYSAERSAAEYLRVLGV